MSGFTVNRVHNGHWKVTRDSDGQAIDLVSREGVWRLLSSHNEWLGSRGSLNQAKDAARALLRRSQWRVIAQQTASSSIIYVENPAAGERVEAVELLLLADLAGERYVEVSLKSRGKLDQYNDDFVRAYSIAVQWIVSERQRLLDRP